MKHRLLILILVALVAVWPSGSVRGASPRVRLIALPSQSHPGSTIYLSGSGFPASTVLPVTIACGSRAVASLPGPRTDRTGAFVAFQMRAWTSDVRNPMRCTVFVRSSKTQQLAAAASAGFSVVPRSQPLARCATHMCLQVQAFLVRLRAGAQGNIYIHGWPGALAQVIVYYPDGSAAHTSARLHWQGQATVRLVIAPGLKKGLQARVQVSARLGSVLGTDTTHFVVVPGGR